MTRLHRLLLVLAGLAAAVAAAPRGQAEPEDAAAGAARPDLAYLMQVNAWRPVSDPQLLFILMGQFANAQRHGEGAAYFDALRRRFDPQLDDTQRAMYATATASLRAGHAGRVALLHRIGWVRDSVALLDEAKRLSRGELFVARWMSGVVRAQLPAFFGEREAAIADLRWCLDHAGRAPHANWLREVYFHLAALHRRGGDAGEAARMQALSGYPMEHKPVTFTTPFSADAAGGHRFSPRRIDEPVPGTVYRVSGFEFTEYYFIVSADRRELISIDAGTRADAAREAHEALRARVPSLPPVTTVLVTHAHWDHVGGQRYFRSLTPPVRFIGRANYADELGRGALADRRTMQHFFGTAFRMDDVLAYRPDTTIAQPTELTIGGTRVSLLPTRGGETDDAMLVHLPQHGVLFVGDITMPYLGAPFTEEGSLDGLLQAIDQVHALKPRVLLHGHEPLTRVFDSAQMLMDLKPHLQWLRDAVMRELVLGRERGALHRANLMPPSLEKSPSSVHLAYLVMRAQVIDRLFDQHSGYWQNGMKGVDTLTDADHGAALVDYLGAGEDRIASAVEKMLRDGRHELAAATLRHAQARLAPSPRLAQLKRDVYLQLMEQVQETDPFRFILYGAQIGLATSQIGQPP